MDKFNILMKVDLIKLINSDILIINKQIQISHLFMRNRDSKSMFVF